MKIGLDWDNTFTRDYDFWQAFVTNAKEKGHQVYITTSRGDDTPIESWPLDIEGVMYCNFNPKVYACSHEHIHIDIWIDDDPKYITEGFILEPDHSRMRFYQ